MSILFKISFEDFKPIWNRKFTDEHFTSEKLYYEDEEFIFLYKNSGYREFCTKVAIAAILEGGTLEAFRTEFLRDAIQLTEGIYHVNEPTQVNIVSPSPVHLREAPL